MRRANVIVWGNGSTLINSKGTYINERTSNLLSDISSENLKVFWCEGLIKDPTRVGLKNSSVPNNVQVIRKNIFSLFLGTRSHNLLFLPSKSNLIIGLFYAYILGKRCDIYLRGEIRSLGLLYRSLFKSKKLRIFLVSDLLVDNINVRAEIVKVKPLIHPIYLEETTSSRNMKNVLFVGRLESEKGIIELCKASQISDDLVSLTVVGDGPLLDGLRAEYPNVKFLGLVSDHVILNELYHKSGLVILPSYHEGFPRVLVEGALCGCCIMSTNVGGVSEVFEGEGFYHINIKDYLSINNQLYQYVMDVEKGLINRQRENVISRLFEGRKELHEIY